MRLKYKKRKRITQPVKKAPCYRIVLFMFRSLQRARKKERATSTLIPRLDEMIRLKNLFWHKL